MPSEADRPLIKPEKLHSNSYATAEQLRALGREMTDSRVSEKTRLLFAELAILPPVTRLAENLRALVRRMVAKPVYNVFSDGLTPSEHAALVELDMRGLTLQARETAHGLLNVHERWAAIRPLRRLFSRAADSHGEFLKAPQENK